MRFLGRLCCGQVGDAFNRKDYALFFSLSLFLLFVCTHVEECALLIIVCKWYEAL